MDIRIIEIARNDKNNDFRGRVVSGVMLIIQFIVFVGLLLWRLLDSSTIIVGKDAVVSAVQVNEAIIMSLAACFGSLISSMRAFFQHACDKRDFSRAYIPWYFFWQIQGFILGLIFYFTVRGGIILVTLKESASNIELNIWGLAAIGSLVGLFSQKAIKKLDDVFANIFMVKEQTETEPATGKPQATNTPGANRPAENAATEDEENVV